MRVLVVDDDKLVAVSLKTILEADGEITVVGLGEAGDDAIRLYREQHPDILLMDIRMQGMSGLDAAECILKEDQAAKILFLTSGWANVYRMRLSRIATSAARRAIPTPTAKTTVVICCSFSARPVPRSLTVAVASCAVKRASCRKKSSVAVAQDVKTATRFSINLAVV